MAAYKGDRSIVGATKLSHVEGMAKAADLCLTKEEIDYLEEPYVPHTLVGVMAQNTAEQAKGKACLVYGKSRKFEV